MLRYPVDFKLDMILLYEMKEIVFLSIIDKLVNVNH